MHFCSRRTFQPGLIWLGRGGGLGPISISAHASGLRVRHPTLLQHPFGTSLLPIGADCRMDAALKLKLKWTTTTLIDKHKRSFSFFGYLILIIKNRRINVLIDGQWLMVHGSWLKDGWGLGRGPSHPWGISHEPLTITTRVINKLFDYLWQVLAILISRRIPENIKIS